MIIFKALCAKELIFNTKNWFSLHDIDSRNVPVKWCQGVFWALLCGFDLHTLESRVHPWYILCVVLYEHTVMLYIAMYTISTLRHIFVCHVFELLLGHRRVAFKKTHCGVWVLFS